MRNILTFLIVGAVLSGFCMPVLAQQVPEPPATLDEAKSVGFQILGELPDSMRQVWREQALPILYSMWDWAQGPWENNIKPKVQELLNWLLGFLGKEIEERAPLIEEEFEKEKDEMIGDVPSVWERFKNLWE
ncbi:MAG: hypothetical protein WC919_07370 [Candidatus Paceibacterota bacterium]|jgi:hypothetical protein|nr:hypothetical protein [Candidatus Paceibacterota bacterium]